jgi:hypothetical protein
MCFVADVKPGDARSDYPRSWSGRTRYKIRIEVQRGVRYYQPVEIIDEATGRNMFVQSPRNQDLKKAFQIYAKGQGLPVHCLVFSAYEGVVCDDTMTPDALRVVQDVRLGDCISISVDVKVEFLVRVFHPDQSSQKTMFFHHRHLLFPNSARHLRPLLSM